MRLTGDSRTGLMFLGAAILLFLITAIGGNLRSEYESRLVAAMSHRSRFAILFCLAQLATEVLVPEAQCFERVLQTTMKAPDVNVQQRN